MREQFEQGRRNSSGNNYGANMAANYNKQFTYFNNGGNNNYHPSKINTEQFKRGILKCFINHYSTETIYCRCR